MEGIFRAAQFLTNIGKRLCILIVPVDVPKFADELGKSCGVDSSVLFDAVLRSSFELLKIPARLGHANYGPNQPSSLCQLLQGRKDLLVSEVAGTAFLCPESISASVRGLFNFPEPAPRGNGILWKSCPRGAPSRCQHLGGHSRPPARARPRFPQYEYDCESFTCQ